METNNFGILDLKQSMNVRHLWIGVILFAFCMITEHAKANVKRIVKYQADTTIVIDTALPDIAFPLTVRKSMPQVQLRQLWKDSAWQKFIIHQGSNSILINANVKLSIDLNDLEHSDGTDVKSSATIAVRKMVKPADFMLLQAPTTNRGALLDIDNGFYISAFAIDKPLRLKNGKTIRIEFAPSNATSTLFYGDTLKTGAVNWQIVTTPNRSEINRLGWIGFGELYTNKQGKIDQYIKLDLGDEYVLPEKASVFLVFKARTIVAAGVSTEVPVLFSFRNIPIGEAVYAVAIVEVNGKYFIGKSDEFSVTDEDIPAVALQEMELSAIYSYINNL
jgi:hypothetical protein